MSRTALQRKGAHARTELRADARGKRREASVKTLCLSRGQGREKKNRDGGKSKSYN